MQNSVPTEYRGGNSWGILSVIEKSIKAKIGCKGVPLKDWNVNIYRGVITGFNEAFIITKQTRDQLVADDPKSVEIIRPILRGRDIKRYHYEFADLYLITTFPSLNYDIDKYPAVKKHFLDIGIERLEQTGKTYVINGEIVRARKKTSNKWFETQDSISYWDDFRKQKIVYREISDAMDACIVEPDIYLNNKCYILTGEHLKYLICIFNSQLFTKIILNNTNLTGGKGYGFLGNVHIPIPNEQCESKFERLYELLINSGTENQEKIELSINEAVFSLYDLTDEEKATVLSN